MAIIYQHDKRTDITYAYDSKSYYDKEKKCSRAKRTLIGRVDPVTGEIVPTDGRNKRVGEKPVVDITADKEKYIRELECENHQLKLQVAALSKELDRLNKPSSK